MRFAASKQSSLRYHLVPPVKLPTRDILRKALFNQCLPVIQRARNKLPTKSGSQASPTYAIQKRHPDLGIKYDRGAFRYFTCKKITAGSAAIIEGQKRTQPHPTVDAIES